MDYIKILSINSCIILILLVACQPQKNSEESHRKPKIEIGSAAPSFTLPDTQGEPFNWNQLQGKYVLLDFWASWCQPCRQESPALVRAYQQFKDKNFTIYSVSLDHNKEAWQKAIAYDQLEWTYHTSDLKGWDNAAALKYGISSIPMNFLIDPQGKIIAKNLRGQMLLNTLDQFLNSQK